MSPSSVERVWQTPELAFAILRNLERERVDLIQLSLVSKSFRQLALKALVRNLTIQLTKVASMADMFEHNAELVNEIRHVRLVDDEVYSTNRWRGSYLPPSPEKVVVHVGPLHPLDSFPIKKWFNAVKLLNLIFPRDGIFTPMLDLSFGIGHIGSLKVVLTSSGRALAAIVALRVIVDQHNSFAQDNIWNDLTAVAQWDAVVGFVRDVRDDQTTRSGSPSLAVFHIEDRTSTGEGRATLRDFTWKHLGVACRPVLEDLRLHLSQRDTTGDSGFLDVFGGDVSNERWDRLRSIALSMKEAKKPFQDSLGGFFERHQGLIDIEVACEYHGDYEFERLLRQTFPFLEVLSVGYVLGTHLESFLRRHEGLRELRVRRVARKLPALPRLQSLRILRAPLALVQALFVSGSQPAQIELADEIGSNDIATFLDWVTPGSPQARAVTCLSFVCRQETPVLDEFIPRIGALLSAARFPELGELVITNDWSDDQYPVFERRSAHYLRLLLTALQSAAKLRALHVKEAGLEPINLKDLPNGFEHKMPPSLEYVSWTSIMQNRNEYFRILRHDQDRPQRGRLQELPSTFALQSIGPGLWQAPGLRRTDDTLFDHTLSPPQLKPW